MSKKGFKFVKVINYLLNYLRRNVMEKFFEAIRNGNVEKMEIMLALGQDVNVKNSDGFSPLNVAISQTGSAHVSGDLFARVMETPNLTTKIVEMLISAGANVNAVEVDSEGYENYPRPLLHFAIYKGQPEIVKLLISAGANVNARDEYGITPLHKATDESAKITAMLISAGANVNAVDKDGNSVLHSAVLCGDEEYNNGNAEIINMLVSAGADVTATNKEGKTAFELMN